MARIYRRTDRITVKIDDITVKLAPLTLDQKTEIQQMVFEGTGSNNLKLLQQGLALCLKYTLKGISGLEDVDGNQYTLSFDNGEVLTDECINDLLNLELKEKLALVCMSLTKGIPNQFTDNNNVPLDGVEVISSDKSGDVEKKS